ncbi:hypothetical protein BAE44_0024054, partial [Dichanthelium oligosanthes]
LPWACPCPCGTFTKLPARLAIASRRRAEHAEGEKLAERERCQWRVGVVRGEGHQVQRRGGARPPELQRLPCATGAVAVIEGEARPECELVDAPGAAARAAEREHKEHRRGTPDPGAEPAVLQRVLRGLLRPHHRGRRRRWAAEALRQRHQLVLRQPPVREPPRVHPVLRGAARHRPRPGRGPGGQEGGGAGRCRAAREGRLRRRRGGAAALDDAELQRRGDAGEGAARRGAAVAAQSRLGEKARRR